MIVVIFMMTTISTVSFAQDEEKPSYTLIENVNIFDGLNDGRTQGSVLIENNLIKEVGSNIKSPEGATVIDGEGRTLMPGLIEMHVHYSIFLPLSNWAKDSLHPYAHGSLALLRANEFLMNGYTTTRDAGGPSNYLKIIIDEGLTPGPRIYPTENFITATSGHGDFRELNDPHPSLNGTSHFYQNYVSIIADGPDEVTRAVRSAFRNGATQIKLFTSGGVSSQFDPLHSGPNPEEIRAAVKVAKQWDTYVLTHSFNESAIRMAIDNGVKCIEHAPFLTDEIAKLMIEKDVYLATAVSAVFEVDDEVARKTYTPASYKKFANVRDAGKNMLEVLKRNPELKVMLGSDLLAPWNKQKETDDKMNLEFSYFGKYLGAFRTLKMATSTAGEANMMTGKMNPYPDGPLGVIKEGAYADILLINGNPLEDIELMTDPEANFDLIMKDGKIYKNTL
jgi:imidazolonepropionase-like amidohydrolase